MHMGILQVPSWFILAAGDLAVILMFQVSRKKGKKNEGKRAKPPSEGSSLKEPSKSSHTFSLISHWPEFSIMGNVTAVEDTG